MKQKKRNKQTQSSHYWYHFLLALQIKKKDNGHTNNKQGMTGRRRVYPRNKTTEMSRGEEEEEEEKPHLPIFDGCPTHPFATGKWRWPTQQQNRLRTKWRVLETWWPCSTTLVYHAPASSCSLRCLVYLSRSLARSPTRGSQRTQRATIL